MTSEINQDSWQVEQGTTKLLFRRQINGRSVVVYYHYQEDCHWYVFLPPGNPVGFDAKGNSACLIEALKAAEEAAQSLPPVPEPLSQQTEV
jgi:hypothetical protein